MISLLFWCLPIAFATNRLLLLAYGEPSEKHVGRFLGGFGLARLAIRTQLERQRYTTEGECTPDWAKSALISQ